MAVRIRPIGHLKSYFNNQAVIFVEPGRTVREILEGMQLKPEVIAGVIVNDVLSTKDYCLQEDDEVMLFAVMGGG